MAERWLFRAMLIRVLITALVMGTFGVAYDLGCGRKQAPAPAAEKGVTRP